MAVSSKCKRGRRNSEHGKSGLVEAAEKQGNSNGGGCNLCLHLVDGNPGTLRADVADGYA